MIVNGYEVKAVCANAVLCSETAGHPELDEYMPGDIYDAYEACMRAHPDSDVMYGFHVDAGGGAPSWFDTAEEAVAYARSLEDADTAREAQKKWQAVKDAIISLGPAAAEDFIGRPLAPGEGWQEASIVMDETYAQMPEEEFEKFLEKHGIQEHVVAFAVDARYYAHVYAQSADAAKAAGEQEYMDADIGGLENVDARIDHVEDAKGNYLD